MWELRCDRQGPGHPRDFDVSQELLVSLVHGVPDACGVFVVLGVRGARDSSGAHGVPRVGLVTFTRFMVS